MENSILAPEKRYMSADALSIETRTFKRMDGTDEQKEVIVGKAIVFNQLSKNLGWFREQIDPRALDGADMSDVVCLKNHDNNIPLGRTPDGLSFEIREDGLYFVSVPPNTTTAKDAIEEIRSGNITGCSFQFSIAVGGQDWDTDPITGGEIRTVKKIAKLYDVGPVTFPAYLQTSVNTEVAKRSFDEFRAAQKPPVEEAPKSYDKWAAWDRKKRSRL